jgi:type IV pilus assembly protein PilX
MEGPMNRYGFTFIHAQRGAALAVSLIILLVMTLLGIAGMRSTTLEERMAGNMRDHHRAFEAAEATLRGAERFIDSTIISSRPFDTNGSDGLYNDADPRIWESVDWTGSTTNANNNESLPYTAFTPSPTRPRFVIQHYATVQEQADKLNLDNYGQGTGAGATELFRITARGTGGSDSAAVILQTTYGKKL